MDLTTDYYKPLYSRLSMGLGPKFEDINEETMRNLMVIWDKLLRERLPESFWYIAHSIEISDEEDYWRWADRLAFSVDAGIAPMLVAFFSGVPVDDIVA